LSPSSGGILATNKLPVGDDQQGLFALTCRMNNACHGASNACHHWEEKLQRELVFASRPIAAGEEITITYRNGVPTYAARQKDLLQCFNFRCKCAACEVNEEEREKADARLKEMNELLREVPNVGESNQAQALEMCERVIRLLELHGADTLYNLAELHKDAFEAAVGQPSKQKEHARKTYSNYLLCRGPLSTETVQSKQLSDAVWCSSPA